MTYELKVQSNAAFGGCGVGARFPLGKLCMTPGAEMRLAELDFSVVELLDRHCRGDWGDVDEEDRVENELSVREGLRVLSVYGPAGSPIWIITEADRSVTTLLLPDEY